MIILSLATSSQNQPLATPIPREKVVLTVLLSKKAKSELLEMFNEGLKEMKRTVNTIKLSAIT